MREWKTGQDAIPALPYILDIKKANHLKSCVQGEHGLLIQRHHEKLR